MIARREALLVLRRLMRGLAGTNPVAAFEVSEVVMLPPARHNRALEAADPRRLLVMHSQSLELL
jgi:hypothetical protein